MKKEDIKIAVFSSFDKTGGAAIACYNCVKMLRDEGYNAIEVVRYKSGDEQFVYPVSTYRRKSFLLRAFEKLFPPKSFRDIKEDTNTEFRFFGDESDSPDMCTIEEIERAIPFIPNVILVGHTFNLVNTSRLAELHEKWGCHIFLNCNDIGAYTGGCHVHWDCKGYTTGCNDCPAVFEPNRKKEVSEACLRKKQNIERGKIGIRYTNNWLKREIDNSFLFSGQKTIQSGQSTNVELYNPSNREIAKQVFGISNNKKTILCGATYLDDKRKGVSYFCKAVHLLWNIMEEDRDNICLLLVGKNRESIDPLLHQLPPFDFQFIEFITDTRLLSLAYQAADVYVSSSLEDAGPMMVCDALACGTPVIGFKTGFIADEEIFRDGQTGYAIEMRDVNSMAERISQILKLSPEKHKTMSQECRKTAVEKLSRQRTLELYRQFFEQL